MHDIEMVGRPHTEQDLRRAPRKRLSIPIVLKHEKTRRVRTMLRDLSLSGFSASTTDRIAPGTACVMTIPGREPMQARVIWCEGGLVGCAFDQQIGQVSYDAILEHWEAEGQPRR